MAQFVAYVIVELVYYIIAVLLMLVVIKNVHKAYVNKQDDMSGKELMLILAILLTVLIGYFAFIFFCKRD